MDLSITQVPIWVNVLFVISFSTLPFYLILKAVKSTYQDSNSQEYKKTRQKIILFYSLYFLAVAIISLTGFFMVNTLPPRILLVTSWPLLLFYFFFIRKKSWFQLILQKIKLEQLILIHAFRFVGVFFFILYYYETLPKSFAYVGGYGDIISAILVFPVIAFLKKKAKGAKALTYIWNILGMLDIFSVMVTAVILTTEAIESRHGGVLEFGAFPFSWIPAFAPATIIFLHVLIFKKLKDFKAD